MARTKTKESRDPSDPIVRVRGGHTGVRFITLSSWKAEIKERKQSRTKRNNEIAEKRKRKRP